MARTELHAETASAPRITALAAAVGLALAIAAARPVHAAPGDQAAAGVGAMTPAAAVDPERRAAARRLLDASRFRARQAVLLDDGLEAARGEVLDGCMNRAAAGKPVDCPATAQPLSRDRRERLLDAIMEGAQTVYAETFTAPELAQLTAFFESDIGRKYARAYPIILSRVQGIKRRLLLNELTSGGSGAARGRKP